MIEGRDNIIHSITLLAILALAIGLAFGYPRQILSSYPLNMPVKKLTRQQIREGFDQIPIESLLSSGKGKTPNLTTKAKNFARGVALGKTKAQAYRDSYKKTATKRTLASKPYVLAKDERVQREIEAYQLALQAEKHRNPAQLKALLIQQLVAHSLDEEFPPAQRVQCLRLIGQLFEVGAFLERKEITTINRPQDIRARLIATLKDVTDIDIKEDDDGDALLNEISQSKLNPIKDVGLILESSDIPSIPFDAYSDEPTAPVSTDLAAATVGVNTHTIPLK